MALPLEGVIAVGVGADLAGLVFLAGFALAGLVTRLAAFFDCLAFVASLKLGIVQKSPSIQQGLVSNL
jgi:hypothetical protein